MMQSNHTGNVSRAVAGYLECAKWADAPEGSRARWHRDARERAARDVAAFVTACGPLFDQALAQPGYTPERFGADFWFTRCGHGVGFWDRDELTADVHAKPPMFDRDGKPYVCDAGEDTEIGDVLSAIAYGAHGRIAPFAYVSLTAYRGWLYFS